MLQKLTKAWEYRCVRLSQAPSDKLDSTHAVLLFEGIHLLDFAKVAKVSPKLFLIEGIRIVDIAHVDVPRATRLHSHSDSGAQRARMLSPANLEPTVVNHNARVRGKVEEGKSSIRIDESDEGDVLLFDESDALQNATANVIADFLGRGF